MVYICTSLATERLRLNRNNNHSRLGYNFILSNIVIDKEIAYKVNITVGDVAELGLIQHDIFNSKHMLT